MRYSLAATLVYDKTCCLATALTKSHHRFLCCYAATEQTTSKLLDLTMSEHLNKADLRTLLVNPYRKTVW
jgi:hypothetical protein